MRRDGVLTVRRKVEGLWGCFILLVVVGGQISLHTIQSSATSGSGPPQKQIEELNKAGGRPALLPILLSIIPPSISFVIFLIFALGCRGNASSSTKLTKFCNCFSVSPRIRAVILIASGSLCIVWALSSFTTGHANSTFVNRMAFVIALILIVLVAALLYFIRKLLDRFRWRTWWWLPLGSLIVLLCVGYLLVVGPQAKYEWLLGLALDPSLGGARAILQESEGCSVVPQSYLPYRYILPRRLFNFFTGPSTCPRVSSFSRWDSNHTLTVTCKHYTPTYQPSPSFFDELDPLALPRYRPSFSGLPFYFDKPTKSATLPFPSPSNSNVDSQYSVALPEDEWARVSCGSRENFHVHYSPRQQPPKAYFKQEDLKEAPNVLVLLLDSVSRQDFISSLPATSKFLEHLAAQQQLLQHNPHNTHTTTQEGVSVFQFFRYHVVGGHTAPNVTPLFTGRRKSAWQAAFSQNNNRLSPPFIWRLYRELLGYETAFLQDGCEDYFDGIWTVTEQDPSPTTNQEREKEANKERKKKTETEKDEKERVRDAKERRRELTGIDHEIVLPFCHPDYMGRAFWLGGVFDGPLSIRRRCMAGDYVHSFAFDYLTQFYQHNQQTKKFAVALFQEGHEGTQEVATTVDDRLHKFLNDMQQMGQLENTIVMLLSDHGNHMSPWFYHTHNGLLEQRLPFLFLVAPNAFLRRHPSFAESLRENEQKLLTAFDIHATLFQIYRIAASYGTKAQESGVGDSARKEGGDLIKNSWEQTEKDWNMRFRLDYAPSQDSISLFQPLPQPRNCDTAQIPFDLCICNK